MDPQVTQLLQGLGFFKDWTNYLLVTTVAAKLFGVIGPPRSEVKMCGEVGDSVAGVVGRVSRHPSGVDAGRFAVDDRLWPNRGL